MTQTRDIAVEAVGGRRSWWLTLLGITVAFGMIVLVGGALLESRHDVWTQARQNAGNLLLALDRDIARNIAVLDLSLIGLVEALAEPGIDDVRPAIRQRALFDRSASAEDLGSMLVLDRNGEVIADSTSLVPHRLSLGDRDYFRVHVGRASNELYVSRAFSSRLSSGDLRFAISRRLGGADGAFAGVVVATLRLSYFRRLFEKLDIGAKGTISVLRTDGRLLYRHPFRAQDIDVDMSQQSRNFRTFVTEKSGQFVGTASLDNVERLFTFRPVGELPLILTVSLSTEEIFAPWRRKAAVIGAVMTVLCASAVASALLFRREMLRRTQTERDLAAAAAQLSVLAATDGLTGLMNRRAFDADFDRAFRSAIRNGSQIAALMIDADFFKLFNDTSGHVAGDDVLRVIAACLTSQLRRPGDIIARYGGEEFVVILPDTEPLVAVELGERIRLAVRERRVQHPASPIGVVSISVGVAVITPMIGDVPDLLLRRADQALYTAKANGRDCLRSLGEPEDRGIDLSQLVAAALAPRAGRETFGLG